MGALDAGPGRTVLIGRRDECRLLRELLDAVRADESRSLNLLGERGMGKTALLEYAAGAARDVRVERASGVESEMGLAFATLHQLCAQMLDRLERLPEPQGRALATAFGLISGPAPDHFLVGLAVLGLLAETAADRPLLCVIDDVQWIDEASAHTLAFVARRVSAEPLGFLFAARQLRAELHGLPTLRLGGLDDHAARALLRSVVGSPLDEEVRDRVIAETRGNPLSLLEALGGEDTMELEARLGFVEARLPTGRTDEIIVGPLDQLSEDTRRLLVLAAAEPAGDPLLLLRASERLGIPVADLDLDGVLALEERVTFCQGLERSAVYRAASAHQRRAVHRALAEATDREDDRDRRAWHLAAATVVPDETVALELEHSADQARARGGFAASAAFLKRASALTPDPGRRVERALAAAQASLYAGAFDGALRLIGAAEAGAPDAFQQARIDLLRAEIAFATRDREASTLLLGAVEQIEPWDGGRARAGYLDALSASLFAARLAPPGAGAREAALTVQAAPRGRPPTCAADLLLDGWAAMFADGAAAATPLLQRALADFAAGTTTPDELHLMWLVTMTAPAVWDDARWEVLSGRYVALARDGGALGELPLALHSRSLIHLFRGELAAASALIDEAQGSLGATGARLAPWGAVALAALRDHAPVASRAFAAAAADDATRRGEGISLTVIAWAQALLNNGCGAYDRALAAAREAIDCPTNSAAAAWGMVELVEAAARVDDQRSAHETSERFSAIARVAGTDWALGVNARLLALLSTGAGAETSYREAIERLGRCPMRVDLARAHLLFGEWLRRQNRRIDARAELRTAHDMFSSIGMEAFAARAARELAATGERMRARTVEARDDLTAQERQIAELAIDGLSNPEIGARLFLSSRTVEWHLRKVFCKLGVSSRRELSTTLPGGNTASGQPEPTGREAALATA